MPNPFRFSKRAQSPPPSSPGGTSMTHESSRVLSRLHALFTPSTITNNNNNHNGYGEGEQDGHQPIAGPSNQPYALRPDRLGNGQTHAPALYGGVDVARAATAPTIGEAAVHEGFTEMVVVPPEPDREAIKVLVVTWNMGDALPKGDLSVLLGEVPPYQPPSPGASIPQLPIENAHPYHIVVVAGQECPTPSGAPRGLGGGLIKGVTLRHKREGREKEKKDGYALEAPERDRDSEEGRLAKSPVPGSDDNGEDEHDPPRPSVSASIPTSATSPITPHTPFLHRPPPATKGWSQMLDDYFCGPGARPEGVFLSVTPSPRDSPSPNPPHTAGLASQPVLIRSASAPITPVTPKGFPTPIPIPTPTTATNTHLNHHLHPHLLSPSPLARSRSSFESTSSSSSSGEGDNSFLTMPAHTFPNQDFPKSSSSSAPSRLKTERPEIVIPVDEPLKTAAGSGSYVHVVKERLLGMYLSIYVYKGCEHLIQGLDKDFVTAGLAGGRVGNKGGIGISLKLADHRFLFVNSHLAAHATRQTARLANIAKIKEELRLDCFLPKDDPRATLPDITDRFDTVFWCGDLNFRLNLSRLHADWLIEQKKYAEALMWDQLKLAMQDPDTNPFPGFEEGQINFPCTFKYDVWKSVRATNRELRRTMRRRKSSASAASVDLGTSVTVQNNLSGVPEGDALEEVDDDRDEEHCEPRRDSEDDFTDAGMSRRSFDSSRYTSAPPSTIGTDLDDDSDDVPTFGQNAQRHRPFEQALKDKTRHLLGLVKMDSILTPSPRKGQLGRRVSRAKRRASVKRRKAEDDEDGYDQSIRRTSMSSYVSRDKLPRPETPEETKRISSSSARSTSHIEADGALNVPDDRAAMQSDYLMGSASPPRDKSKQPLTKKLSIMKRTMSGVSVREGEEDDEDYVVGMDEDHREGRYDTSKKQRVPSWCDRVLWKAHVEPDPEPDINTDTDLLDVPSLDREKRLHRLSSAFANFGGHFRSIHTGRTPSMDVPAQDRAAIVRTAIPEPNMAEPSDDEVTTTLVASPSASPSLETDDDWGAPGLIPAPRKASPARSSARQRNAFPFPHQHIISQSSPLARPASPSRIDKSISDTSSFEPIQHNGRSSPSPLSSQTAPAPGHAKIMVESPSSPTLDKLRVTLLHSSRPRSNSDCIVGGTSTTAVVTRDENDGGGQSTPKKGRSSDGHLTSTVSPALSRSRGVPLVHANTLAVPPLSEPRERMRSHNAPIIPLLGHPIRSETPKTPEPPNPPTMTVTRHPSPSPERSPSRIRHTSSSTSTHPNGTVTLRENDKNAFVRFLRDLPGWLHVRGASVHENDEKVVPENESDGEKKPRRHLKGEVVCLHYGTIDDAGMRQLEGRSDHRPAIFSAAVYV